MCVFCENRLKFLVILVEARGRVEREKTVADSVSPSAAICRRAFCRRRRRRGCSAGVAASVKRERQRRTQRERNGGERMAAHEEREREEREWPRAVERESDDSDTSGRYLLRSAKYVVQVPG
ncbi:hypothetical protein Nepgr_003089 [Nepenthes gracilis]|uniref:Uncharacterized protein n=1 Tax=Nepenthes gracilis TaxID=150966 RepID=A0AAD3RYV4_NEPGR|nr:hypothetical protein Nepgr_003089 [Nepenthes gracilis]